MVHGWGEQDQTVNLLLALENRIAPTMFSNDKIINSFQIKGGQMTSSKKFQNLGLLLVIVFIIGAFSYFKSQPESPGFKGELPSVSEISPEMEEMAESEEILVKAVVMEDENTLSTQLEDVTGGESSGTAYVLRKDGRLYHYVSASLPTPPRGTVYEGWLVNKTPTLKFFSTGVMLQENGVYVLTYDADGESLGYNEVVITLETKVDKTPEKHILEGVVN